MLLFWDTVYYFFETQCIIDVQNIYVYYMLNYLLPHHRRKQHMRHAISTPAYKWKLDQLLICCHDHWELFEAYNFGINWKCKEHKLWSYFTALFCEITVLHCAKLLILYTQLYLMPLCTETSQNSIYAQPLCRCTLQTWGYLYCHWC